MPLPPQQTNGGLDRAVRSSGDRLPAIDVARGFAIAWVLAYHVWTDLRYPDVYPVQGDAFRAVGSRLSDGDVVGAATGVVNAFLRVGYLGVPLFMMLSGLSLTLSAARRGGTPSWPRFLARRLRRVMVPYWFGFAMTVAFAVALAFVQWQRHGGGFEAYLTHGDIPLDSGTLFAGAAVVPRAFRDSWRFAPEGSLWFVLLILQYYLLFPFLLAALRRIGPLAFVALTAVVTWTSLAAMVAVSGDLVEHGTWVEMAAPFRLFEFGAGMGIGWVMTHGGRPRASRIARTSWPLGICGAGIFVAACLVDVSDGWAGTLQAPGVVLAFVVALGPMLIRAPRWVSASIAGRCLAWAGVVSYTLLIISEPLRSVTHTMSAEDAPDVAIVAWALLGMAPITLLLARPLARTLGLIERDARLTVDALIGSAHADARVDATTPSR